MTTTINNEHNKHNVPNLRFKGFQGEWKELGLSELLDFKNGLNPKPNKFGKGIKFISEYSADLVDTYMIIDSSGFISTSNQHFDLRFNALKEPINNFVNQIKFNFEGESKRYA